MNPQAEPGGGPRDLWESSQGFLHEALCAVRPLRLLTSRLHQEALEAVPTICGLWASSLQFSKPAKSREGWRGSGTQQAPCRPLEKQPEGGACPSVCPLQSMVGPEKSQLHPSSHENHLLHQRRQRVPGVLWKKQTIALCFLLLKHRVVGEPRPHFCNSLQPRHKRVTGVMAPTCLHIPQLGPLFRHETPLLCLPASSQNPSWWSQRSKFAPSGAPGPRKTQMREEEKSRQSREGQRAPAPGLWGNMRESFRQQRGTRSPTRGKSCPGMAAHCPLQGRLGPEDRRKFQGILG